MDRWLTLPERRPGRTVMTIGLLFLLAYGASLFAFPKSDGRVLLGDAVHQYVYLRSLVFDGDLQFRNDYIRMYGLTAPDWGTAWVYEQTATGHVRNLMPIGPALLWAPAFLITTAAVWMADALGAHYPFDGFGRVFQASAAFSGIIAATLGCWLTFRTAARLFQVRTAIWAVIGMWLSSSAVYYSLISPAYSHAASMLAVSAAWFVWLSTLERQTVQRYFIVGVFCGIAALMRWQDAVLLVVPAIDACWHWRDRPRLTLARLVAAAAGAALAFVPQMLAWMTLYGQPFAIPQGPGFMKWTEPALWSVLFSANHGLISWTPVIAVALVGMIPLYRRAPLVAVAAIAFFTVSWYVNASVADWWAGEAFGARRFVSCFPVFVLGLAALLDRARLGTLAVIIAAFTVHTLLLLVQYQAFMHGLRQVVAYPATDLLLGRFRASINLVAWWWHR
jgi:4-amino-4-deoxy-L-arabinose transferase-like glycosyltransferase